MIRVAIVDDHHAVRLGLGVAIQSEPGLVPAGVAATAAELAPLLYRTRPDVVLLDYNLPDTDGLTVCRHIKSEVPAPGVILYSAFADASMTVPAIVAGADGILNKGVPARELFEAIREVARGGDALPAISTEMLEVASLTLDDEDLPILGMLIDRTPPHDIADTLRLELPALRWRMKRMLGRLQASVGRVRHPLDVRADESRSVWVDSPTRPRNCS
jgi:two-component system response regulator DevR